MARSARTPDAILRGLEWTVLRRLEGLLQGDYRTLFRGAGIDLSNLREYQDGDDVRYIDWNVTARLQTLQSKLVDGSATPAERAEVMSGVKQVMKLNGLKGQVSAVSHAAQSTETSAHFSLNSVTSRICSSREAPSGMVSPPGQSSWVSARVEVTAWSAQPDERR